MSTSKESKKIKGVLADHKRHGKRLIPPMLQQLNIAETSFNNTTLPELIWISALFSGPSDKLAVDTVIEFQIACQKVIANEKSPSLSFISSFDKLSDAQKQAILSDDGCRKWIEILRVKLKHQNALLVNYPLAFIFTEKQEFDRPKSISLLKQDVQQLLDRRSHHATKVQTTALFAMMATGKMFIHKSIELPDPNVIFTDPGSPESKKVASFVRSSLNAGITTVEGDEAGSVWCNDFWQQVYKIEGCY